MGSLQQDNEGAAQRERISRSSKVPSHWLGPRMNTASPTILRTRHKFGDYLSQPDLAKFELPKKMSRPWIVNNAFEQEKLKDLFVTERPVEASLVMRQIKESKQERKKQPGYNKKHVRNINDIIEKDQKTVKESKKKQPTKEHVEKKRKHMLKKQVGVGAGTQDDATAALSHNVVAKDHVAGNKEDTPPVETDVELEQQRMMNRVFNCPNLYSAAGPFTTMVQMVPPTTRPAATSLSTCRLNLCQSTLPSPSMSSTHSPRTPPSPPPTPTALLPPQTTALSTGRTWRARPAVWWRWRTTSSWWRWWTTSSWSSAWTPPWS